MSATPSAVPVEDFARLRMTAVVQDRYGTTAVLANRAVARPETAGNQILVRVHAAGVNIADWAVMSGLPYIARPIYGFGGPKARVRGTDVAGVVESVGGEVTRFKAGDEVFGSADGSFADFGVATEEQLARKPSNLSFEQAAASPMAGLVALQALRTVKSGQSVLINGASGGVGTFAVQIAKAMDAEVTGVCSSRNVEMVRSIGAHHVIDYTTDNFTAGGGQYDLILDNVGNHSLSKLRRALTPTGTLVSNGGGFDNRWFASAGRLIAGKISFARGTQTMTNFVVAMGAEQLAALTALIEAGKVTPVIDRTYPLSEAAAAITHVSEGHPAGKIAIAIA